MPAPVMTTCQAPFETLLGNATSQLRKLLVISDPKQQEQLPWWGEQKRKPDQDLAGVKKSPG